MEAISIGVNDTYSYYNYCYGIDAFWNFEDSFTHTKDYTSSLSTELGNLKSLIDIASIAVDVDDNLREIQNAMDYEETQYSSLTLAYDQINNYVMDVGVVESEVASVIGTLESNFYKEYSYLKPEARKGFWEKAGEWLADNWIILVTVVVVVVICIVCVYAGAGLLLVAAIASLVSLAISVVDIGFLLFTGMDLGDFLRSKGLNVLADIIDGVSIGCDIVSIVFPAVSFVKTAMPLIAKEGLKAFLTSTKKAAIISLKKTGKDLFCSGPKSFFKTAFKLFVFDFDDLKAANTSLKLCDSAQWISDGEKLIPNLDVMGQDKFDECWKVLDQLGLDGIPINSHGTWDTQELNKQVLNNLLPGQYPDGIQIEIADFSDQRGGKYVKNPKNGPTNFSQANNGLISQYKIDLKELEQSAGIKFTWHEELNMQTIIPLPKALHDGTFAYTHLGGVGTYKFMIPRINNMVLDTSRVVIPNTFQFTIDKFDISIPLVGGAGN